MKNTQAPILHMCAKFGRIVNYSNFLSVIFFDIFGRYRWKPILENAMINFFSSRDFFHGSWGHLRACLGQVWSKAELFDFTTLGRHRRKPIWVIDCKDRTVFHEWALHPKKSTFRWNMSTSVGWSPHNSIAGVNRSIIAGTTPTRYTGVKRCMRPGNMISRWPRRAICGFLDVWGRTQ